MQRVRNTLVHKKYTSNFKGHVLSGEGGQMDKVSTWNRLTDQVAHTNWRRPMTGQVRTHDDTAQARGTHQLESAKEETSQYMERKRSREELSPTRYGREQREG